MPKPPASFWRNQASVYGKPEHAPEWMEKAMDSKPREKSTEPRGRPEEVLQLACCKLLRGYKNILFFSVPNHLHTGKANTREEQLAKERYIDRQKMLGMLPGVSDLVCIFRNSHGAPAIAFAELKAGSNTTSDNQDAFLEKASGLGAYTSIVRSVADLMNLLKTAGYPFPPS